MKKYQYYIFGYSDYIKNSLSDVLNLPNVEYYDLYNTTNCIKQLVHRVFVSRHVHLLSKIMMPFCKKMYLRGRNISINSSTILIMYEINPLSNKQQWIRQMRKDYPGIKIVYIFTNIIDEHRLWRIEQINKNRDLYDLVLTFNKSDAEKYNMDYYEGVFSALKISEDLVEKAEECDVYFCGLEKGRLPMLISLYETLTSQNIKCIFDIIYAKESERQYYEGVRYHDQLLNNEQMLANVMKSKCILEVMVDTTQPGSSLRMCESIAFKKKLLTNNPYAKEKTFFNPKQMYYFSTPENIDASFIFNRLEENEYLDSDLLSPIKLLDYIEQRMMKKDKDE